MLNSTTKPAAPKTAPTPAVKPAAAKPAAVKPSPVKPARNTNSSSGSLSVTPTDSSTVSSEARKNTGNSAFELARNFEDAWTDVEADGGLKLPETAPEERAGDSRVAGEWTDREHTETRPDGGKTTTGFYDSETMSSFEREQYRADGSKESSYEVRVHSPENTKRESNVAGTRLFGEFGHDNGQQLVDSVNGVGRNSGRGVVQQSGSVDRLSYDEKGDVSEASHTDFHNWKKKDGSSEVTRFQTEGESDTWQLQKQYADGSEARQTFREGTNDTWIDRATTKDGWDVRSSEAKTPELADEHKPTKPNRRATVPHHSMVEQKTKDGGSIDDIRSQLGEDYDRLMKSDPEFAQAMEQLQGQELGLMSVERTESFVDNGDRNGRRAKNSKKIPRTEHSHSLAFAGDDGVGVLSRSGENGWSYRSVEESGSTAGEGNEDVLDPHEIGKASGTWVADQTTTLMERVEGGVKKATGAGADVAEALPGGKGASGVDAPSKIGKLSELTGGAADAFGIGTNSLGLAKAINEGDLAKGVEHTGGLAGSTGGYMMAANGVREMAGKTALPRMAKAGKALGLVGAAYDVGNGFQKVTQGNHGGWFDMAAGGGAAYAILGSNPVGWGVAVAGTAGSLTYDHLAGTDIAEREI